MKFTVMVVDDVSINLEILHAILSPDYQVVTAESGEEAIRKMEAAPPDMALLDVSMPGMDGLEVQRFMNEHDELSDIPVIFVTGKQDADTEEKGLMMGAVDYIRKPFNADIIRVKVRNHLEMKAYRDNLEAKVRERTLALAASRDAIIMGMSLMSEFHDQITGEHISRIKHLTGLLSHTLLEIHPDLLTPALAEQTILYSPLHDVGKIAITDTILKKTGALTREEFDIMKTHTTGGAELLRKTEQFLANGSGELQVAIDIAESHHERFDGTGYPHRLAGEAIPVPARIVALADVYDALRSSRPYKKAFTHEESVHIICVGDGRTSPDHFDPRVLEAFIRQGDAFARSFQP